MLCLASEQIPRLALDLRILPHQRARIDYVAVKRILDAGRMTPEGFFGAVGNSLPGRLILACGIDFAASREADSALPASTLLEALNLARGVGMKGVGRAPAALLRRPIVVIASDLARDAAKRLPASAPDGRRAWFEMNQEGDVIAYVLEPHPRYAVDDALSRHAVRRAA